jgi:hypothetical protein
VLRYLPTNLHAPEIAAERYVSLNTVRTQLRDVYAELGVHSRGDAVNRAARARPALTLLAQPLTQDAVSPATREAQESRSESAAATHRSSLLIDRASVRIRLLAVDIRAPQPYEVTRSSRPAPVGPGACHSEAYHP